MQQEEVEAWVESALAGSSCTAEDLTGTSDHWRLRISWNGFDGMSLLQQHRRVMEIMRPRMEGGGDGAVHAVEIHTTITE